MKAQAEDPESYGIVDYSWTRSGRLVVEGNVDLSGRSLSRLPFQFETVSGYFSCALNRLRTLEGAPREVGVSFLAFQNQLDNLDHSPRVIGEDFDCAYNNLKTLRSRVGGPVRVGRSFNCSHNLLTDLQGAPRSAGAFMANFNKLRSLRGAPRRLQGNFGCHHNLLPTLADAPRHVGGFFSCSDNLLQTLKGGPIDVGWDFSCYNNRLKDLVGAPRRVGRHFDCSLNCLTSLRGAPGVVPGDFFGYYNKVRILSHSPRRVGGHFICADNALTSLKGAPQDIGGECSYARNPVVESDAPKRARLLYNCPPLRMTKQNQSIDVWLKIRNRGENSTVVRVLNYWLAVFSDRSRFRVFIYNEDQPLPGNLYDTSVPTFDRALMLQDQDCRDLSTAINHCRWIEPSWKRTAFALAAPYFYLKDSEYIWNIDADDMNYHGPALKYLGQAFELLRKESLPTLSHDWLYSCNVVPNHSFPHQWTFGVNVSRTTAMRKIIAECLQGHESFKIGVLDSVVGEALSGMRLKYVCFTTPFELNDGVWSSRFDPETNQVRVGFLNQQRSYLVPPHPKVKIFI